MRKQRAFRFIGACAVVLALSACSASRDGIRLGFGPTAPNQSQYDQARSQLEQNAQSTVARKTVEGALSTDARPGILVVGTLGPLRKSSTKELKAAYPAYAKNAEKWHPGHAPYLTEADFDGFVGWTTIETYAVPGVFNVRQPALVRRSDVGATSFASTLGSAFFGTTGDLVGARSNEDGYTVIDRVLCRDADPDYRQCASAYERGRYDANTGQALTLHLKPKPDGVQIDPVTFKVIHSAS